MADEVAAIYWMVWQDRTCLALSGASLPVASMSSAACHACSVSTVTRGAATRGAGSGDGQPQSLQPSVLAWQAGYSMPQQPSICCRQSGRRHAS